MTQYTKRQREATYGSVVVQVAPYRVAGTQAEPDASPEATAAVVVVVHRRVAAAEPPTLVMPRRLRRSDS